MPHCPTARRTRSWTRSSRTRRGGGWCASPPLQSPFSTEIRRPGIRDGARGAVSRGSRSRLLPRRSCNRRGNGVWASLVCGRLRHLGDDRSPEKVSGSEESAVSHLSPRVLRTDYECADTRRSPQGHASHAACTVASPVKAAEGSFDFVIRSEFAPLCLRKPFEHRRQMGLIDRLDFYFTPRQVKNGAGDVVL